MKTKQIKRRKPSQVEIYRDALAGVKYADAQLVEFAPGQEVRMFWERSNPADPNAIRVETAFGVKLGYIKRTDTAKLHWYRIRKIKLRTIIAAHYPANPSWESLYIQVTAPSILSSDVEEEML